MSVQFLVKLSFSRSCITDTIYDSRFPHIATPDVSQYQFDETSGYYYDSSTGLYYDANSQYYYNSETANYLYWDPEKSTYIQAPQTDSTTRSQATVSAEPSGQSKQTVVEAQPQTAAAPIAANSENGKEAPETKKPDVKQDKVKVAKKIVKDMEKWAKQLNQKKEYASQAMQLQAVDDAPPPSSTPRPALSVPRSTNGYADVGFTILENPARLKANLDTTLTRVVSYASDSDTEANEPTHGAPINEKNLVDYDKLTCLLCKRAFQSLEILNKHTKLSNLHKENLQKLQASAAEESAAAAYRDRAKERRKKYGEVDPPPPNRARERYEKEMRKQNATMQKQASSSLAATPIGESNVGNRLLQKMGWSEGQGLGKSNQGRTNIIEVSV